MVPVIVVDDEPLVGESLVRSFCRLGWTGRLITNPLQIEAVMAVENPLLLVSDLRMPARSGIEVLSFARDHYPHVKRCLLSGSLGDLRPGDLDRIRPCFLLDKPWGPESLRQLMAESAID